MELEAAAILQVPNEEASPTEQSKEKDLTTNPFIQRTLDEGQFDSAAPSLLEENLELHEPEDLSRTIPVIPPFQETPPEGPLSNEGHETSVSQEIANILSEVSSNYASADELETDLEQVLATLPKSSRISTDLDLEEGFSNPEDDPLDATISEDAEAIFGAGGVVDTELVGDENSLLEESSEGIGSLDLFALEEGPSALSGPATIEGEGLSVVLEGEVSAEAVAVMEQHKIPSSEIEHDVAVSVSVVSLDGIALDETKLEASLDGLEVDSSLELLEASLDGVEEELVAPGPLPTPPPVTEDPVVLLQRLKESAKEYGFQENTRTLPEDAFLSKDSMDTLQIRSSHPSEKVTRPLRSFGVPPLDEVIAKESEEGVSGPDEPTQPRAPIPQELLDQIAAEKAAEEATELVVKERGLEANDQEEELLLLDPKLSENESIEVKVVTFESEEQDSATLTDSSDGQGQIVSSQGGLRQVFIESGEFETPEEAKAIAATFEDEDSTLSTLLDEKALPEGELEDDLLPAPKAKTAPRVQGISFADELDEVKEPTHIRVQNDDETDTSAPAKALNTIGFEDDEVQAAAKKAVSSTQEFFSPEDEDDEAAGDSEVADDPEAASEGEAPQGSGKVTTLALDTGEIKSLDMEDFDSYTSDFFDVPSKDPSFAAEREYNDLLSRQQEERREVRNRFLVILPILILLGVVAFIFIRLYAVPSTTQTKPATRSKATTPSEQDKPTTARETSPAVASKASKTAQTDTPSPSKRPVATKTAAVRARPLAQKPEKRGSNEPSKRKAPAKVVAKREEPPTKRTPSKTTKAPETRKKTTEPTKASAKAPKATRRTPPTKRASKRPEPPTRREATAPEKRRTTPAADHPMGPEASRKYFKLGLNQFLAGKTKRAEDSLQKSARANPSNPAPHRVLAMLYIQKKDKNKAQQAFTQFKKLSPKSPFVRMLRKQIARLK